MGKAIRIVGNTVVDARGKIIRTFRDLNGRNLRTEALDKAVVQRGKDEVARVADILSSREQTRRTIRNAAERKKTSVLAGIKRKKTSVLAGIKGAQDYARTHTGPEMITDLGGKIAKSPVATLGTAGGYIMVPLTGIYVPGTTAASVGGQVLLDKVAPGVSKATNQIYEGTLGQTARNAYYKFGTSIFNPANWFRVTRLPYDVARTSVKVGRAVDKVFPGVKPRKIVYAGSQAVMNAFA